MDLSKLYSEGAEPGCPGEGVQDRLRAPGGALELSLHPVQPWVSPRK